MKHRIYKDELVQQVFYALLGLAFLMMLFSANYARSAEVATVTATSPAVSDSQVVMTGEITSIEGDGFALKHDNGTTLVSLKDIEDDKKVTLSDAGLIKVGNMVTVTGELDKGRFNNPIVMASNLTIVEKMGAADTQ